MTPADRSPPGAKAAEFRHGWMVLLGSTLAVSLGIPALPVYTNGVFVRPLEAEFGWARADISMAMTASILAVALVSPAMGVVVDRMGARRLAPLALVAMAVAYLALSHVQGDVRLFIGLQVLLNLVGVGASPISMSRVINRWFHHAKGLALGLTMAGLGVTAAIGPGITAKLVEEIGWRHAYLALGSAPLLLAGPIAWLLAREDKPPVDATAAPTRHHTGVTVAEAMRTPVFWRLIVTFVLMATGVSGFVLHLAPMLQDQGLSPVSAARILATMGVAVLAGRVATGFLVDHFFAPRVTAMVMAIGAAGALCLAFGGLGAAPLGALGLGFALGAETDLVAYLAARYFGLREYGRVYGYLYCAFMTGSGVSALLIARLQAQTGGYLVPLCVCAGVLATAAALFLTAPPFPHLDGDADGSVDPILSAKTESARA